MSTGKGKRKCEDEISSTEIINNPCKRLKLEDIIFDDILMTQESTDKPIKSTAVKRRQKLLTAIHLKKKYKYYCKKHDVTYLIESVRKESKDLSKKSRDNFVQRFRDLRVSLNFQNVKEGQCDTDDDIDVPNIDKEISVESDINWPVDALPASNAPSPLRKYSTISNLISESESSEKSWALPVEIKNRFKEATANFMDRVNFSEDDEDSSDSSDDGHRSKCSKMKPVKCLIVKKLPGSNQLMFQETDDFIESGIEDNACDSKAECDCSDHENLRRKFLHVEYESPLDADDSDSFTDISTDD